MSVYIAILEGEIGLGRIASMKSTLVVMDDERVHPFWLSNWP
jgi:hypothetical protein